MGGGGAAALVASRGALGDDGARVERHDGPQLRHGVEVERGEDSVGHEEHHGVGVVDDVLCVGGVEVVEHRHYYGTVGDGGHECYDPVGRVAAQECDFVAGDDAGEFEKQVQTGDAARQVAITDCFAAHIVGEGRQGEIVGKAVLVYLQQVVVGGDPVLFFELICHFLSLFKFRKYATCSLFVVFWL